MIAALTMYDLPELRDATDAWWQALARALRHEAVTDVPDRLSRPADPHDAWHDPSLLLAQTCGYPLTHRLAGVVRLVATPCYAAKGCDGPLYSSAVVVRADDPARIVADLRGRHATYNGPDSQSGYNTLRALVAPLARDGRFFGRVTRSGAHRLSLAAVREGRADCAAIDAVTLALIGRQAPAEADGIRVLAWTAPAPGLPYVTAIARDDGMVARIRQAVLAAAEDDDAADARAALLLSGFATPDRAAYATIDAMETAAQAAGYPVLA